MTKERNESPANKGLEERIGRDLQTEYEASYDGHESVFYIPENEKNPMYTYHWAREFNDGQLDEKELHKFIVRQGWEFASLQDHPSFNFKGLKEHGDNKVRIPGHVLVKTLTSRVEARKENSRRHRIEQMQSVAEFASGGDMNMYQEANETTMSKAVKAKSFQ